ncbi:unnamed protein product [Cuscuta epithymum]|uniref:Uncharacterized protein n=1 Tax=Cuscuta epithymum TaxID=186058 RepID=A0AAV0CL59_9ASTE|nr:unnamed protein product [Cuscuta epithymum]
MGDEVRLTWTVKEAGLRVNHRQLKPDDWLPEVSRHSNRSFDHLNANFGVVLNLGFFVTFFFDDVNRGVPWIVFLLVAGCVPSTGTPKAWSRSPLNFRRMAPPAPIPFLKAASVTAVCFQSSVGCWCSGWVWLCLGEEQLLYKSMGVNKLPGYCCV